MTLWLKLAERVLEKRDSFAQLVRIGLAYGDASTIRPWLEVGARRLGGRRLVALLRKEHNVRPRQVALTCYWLPSLARSPAEKHEIQQFIDAVQQDAPERTEK